MEYLPPFYFHPIRPRFKRSNLRVDESQCLKILIFKKNCVSANSRRSETGLQCRMSTIIPGENNPIYSCIKKI